MQRSERLARIDEVDRYSDWLVENDPRKYQNYHYERTNYLDSLAGPQPGELLEVTFAGQTFLVEIKARVC